MLTVISILLSPAAAVAEETANPAIRGQVFEEAISTSIRAGTARELAAARAQAEQELRSLPARFQRHGSTEVDLLALRDAVEPDLHRVLGATENRHGAVAVRDAGGS